MVDLHPPRKPNNGDDGDLLAEDAADATNYSAQAKPLPQASTAPDKAKHALYTADSMYGIQFYDNVLKGTDLEAMVLGDADAMRYSAMKYQLQCLFPAEDTEDDREAVLREQLTGQRQSMDDEGPTTMIRYNEQLPQRKGWLNYYSRIRPVLEAHRVIAADEDSANFLTEAALKRPLIIKIKQMERYNKATDLFASVAAADTFLKAIMTVVRWDLKEENQCAADKMGSAAYNVAGKAYQDKEGLEDFSMHGRLEEYYYVNIATREIKVSGNHRNIPGWKCLNCGGPGHKIKDCRKAPGPHTLMADGTAKKHASCRFQHSKAGCDAGPKTCPFIHTPKAGGGKGGSQRGGKANGKERTKETSTCTSSNCNRETDEPHHRFCDPCFAKRGKKTKKSTKRKAGYTYEVKKKSDGTFVERQRPTRSANHVDDAGAADDDDSSDDDSDTEMEHRGTKHRKTAKWSSWSPIALVTTMMLCLPLSAIAFDPSTSNSDDITIPIDHSAFGVWNFNASANTPQGSFMTVNMTSENTYTKTGSEFIAVNDGGASIDGGTNDKRDYKPGTYVTFRTPQICKDAGGKRHKILGYGDIGINVKNKRTGSSTVTLRKMLYIPTFKSKLVGHNQLLREGAGFHDVPAFGSQPARSFWQFPGGESVDLRKRHGLNYWVGTINKTPTKADMTQDFEANITTTEHIGILKALLQDQNVKGRPQKESLIRCRIAELGEYEPKSDPQKDNLLKLHAKLGHPSPELTARYINENYTVAEKLKLFGKPGRLFCEHCKLAKCARAPRNTTAVEKEKEFGMKTYMDISGRYVKAAVGTDYHYELAFIDSYTGYGTIVPLQSLTQVTDATRRYLQWMMKVRKSLLLPTSEKFTDDSKPGFLYTDGMWNADLGMRIHTDGANYFTSRLMDDMASKFNVDVEHAPMHSQWVNGVVERWFGTIHRRAASMRHAAGLKHETWYWSDQHACRSNNILPVTRHGGKSPHELVHGKKYDLHRHHQTFGCTAYVKNPTHNKHSDDTVGMKGIYLGKQSNGNQNVVWFPATSKKRSVVIKTNNATFGEQELSEQLISGSVPFSTPGDEPFGDSAIDEGYESNDGDDQEPPLQDTAEDKITTTQKRKPAELLLQPEKRRVTTVDDSEHAIVPDEALADVDTDVDLGTKTDEDVYHIEKFLNVRGSKQKHKHYLVKYAGYETPEWQSYKNLTKDVSFDDLKYLIKKFNAKRKEDATRRVHLAEDDDELDWHNDCNQLSHESIQDDYMDHVHFTLGKTYTSPVKAFADPVYGDMFKKASQLEHDNARKRGLAVPILLEDVPKGERIWNSTETFVLKANEKGELERAKARMAFDGSRQPDEDIAGGTVWTPKWTTVRWLFSFAAGMEWNVWSLDIPVAFGQVEPSKTRYMYYPYGTRCVDERGGTMVLKVGNIYGSRDAGLMYGNGMDKWMKSIGFVQNEYDPSLYCRKATANEKEIHVCWYVDDAAITTADTATAEWFNKQVQKRWQMPGTSTKFGLCKMFLGMNVTHAKKSIKLSSHAYINNMVKELQADGTLPKDLPTPKTPLAVKTRISRDDCAGKPRAKSKYRTFAARINWLAVTTRPDLAFAAHVLAKVADDPSEIHYEALYRVICYAAHTAKVGLKYTKQKKAERNQIISSADSSDCDDPTTRKSTSGYVTMMNGSAIAWASKTQTIRTLSSCESEIVSSCDAIRDILWIRYMTESQQRGQHGATPLGQDNASAIRIQNNPWLSQQSRSKHIHRRWLWQYDHIKEGSIRLYKVNTTEMESDSFTKALGRQAFEKLRAKFMSE